LVWLLFFIIYIGSLTGYVVLLVLALVFAFSQSIKQKNRNIRVLLFSVLCVVILVAKFFVFHELRYFVFPEKIEQNSLDTLTSRNNAYRPFYERGMLENGHWVSLYVSDIEIDAHWAEFSSIPIAGYDYRNQPIKRTLIRYLTSKNLRKDYDGLLQLTAEDIINIENGCTNYRFTTHFNVFERIYEVIWEFHYYLQGYSPAGHSVTQRFEFIKCALHVFYKHPLYGTGPGNLMSELKLQYPEQAIVLPQQFWLKPHNQYILFLVQYGIIGFAIIFIGFIGIYIYAHKYKSILSISWFTIAFISFLNEDTLENLNGLVFFAFFGCFFLCAQPIKWLTIRQQNNM
jgi:hypothetical protein